MINESIESFLSNRTVRDVTASEPLSRLHNEYIAYCIFSDILPNSYRNFGAYLRATGRRQIRGRGGRAHIQGLKMPATYNNYDL